MTSLLNFWSRTTADNNQLGQHVMGCMKKSDMKDVDRVKEIQHAMGAFAVNLFVLRFQNKIASYKESGWFGALPEVKEDRSPSITSGKPLRHPESDFA